ncbi:MAG: GspE/PulE family protein [bacterium]
MKNLTVSKEILSWIPRKMAQKYCCIPVDRTNGALKVLISGTPDIAAMEELSFYTDLDIVAVRADEIDIQEQIEILYGSRSQPVQGMDHLLGELRNLSLDHIYSSDNVEEIKKTVQAEPIVKAVDKIIDEAIKAGASDVHIEPQKDVLQVRNRIDGILMHNINLPLNTHSAITSRIKILASMDIAEKRIPQDGRIKRIVDSEEIDLRISTLPTHYGEKTVIRILKHGQDLFDLAALGIEKNDMFWIEEMINKPQGMFFVTGPTGSGKSSTLFSFLSRIKSKAINIVTIENPIEIKLDNINQVQINEKAGLTFASCLRSILRQDPDVILVGEIRDRETAEIAFQSAQTGHLVFSTLHTNDSVSAITRLRDLKVEPFLISSSVLGIIAQRLVRVICSHCKERYETTKEVLFNFKHLTDGKIEVPESYIGRGCGRCGDTGYQGRVGIFEFLKIDNDIREMIVNNASEVTIKNAALKKGYKRLVQSGLEKVQNGVTTIEELLRVVIAE